MSNTAAIIPSSKACLVVEDRTTPSPQGSELLIRNRALATNPVDWKVQDHGYFFTKYPNVLGSDIAGTVEAVGTDVKLFKKGDRVTGYAASIANGDPNHGAFQLYSLLNENVTTKLPDDITFEEGAILPMAIATAGVAIFLDLAVPREGKQSGGFLVWGASSSVGSAAVQIARSLGFTVYAVCSPKHHSKTREYGASHVFDYNDANVIANIVQAAKQNNDTIKLAFDAISEGNTPEQVTSVLEQQGGGKMGITLPFPESAKKPENVEVLDALAFRICTDAKDLGAWLFNEWLAKGLTDKTYVPSPGIEEVEGGIPSVQKALDLHRKGLSGKKLVIPLD
ncbi:MAG: hypothetical protein L6R41_000955 [Letrouitia leprolyta]|nr:MAG: hypothetical protein L6R41_000955 [Letrouitia leprolyta]